LTTAVGVLVGVGSSARISIVLGAGKTETAELLLGNALTLTLLNAAIYLTAFGIFLDPLLVAFGASDVTLPYAREYMTVMMPGLMLTNVAFSLNNVMRATGYPRRAMVTMLIGAAANVLLDPIFIRVLGLGIAGAAWATDIAMLLSSAFVMWHFFTPSTHIRFRRGTFAIRWKILISIVSIGAAPALVNAASCAINAIANNTLRIYGSDIDIAAMGIVITFTSLIVTVILGVCQGMQPVIGYNYGAGRIGRLRRAYFMCVGVASLLTVTGALISGYCPQIVSRCFTSDPELIASTDHALHLAMYAFPVVGFQIISTSFFQSIGNAAKSIVVGLLRQVIFLIPLLILLPRELGITGVWLSFPVSDALATVITFVLVLMTFRTINRRRELKTV
ncbi:MAG: MATE family efflux transporter, partial [Muribaculaceae bacterium]|nr:MATE family efflux transporter [Muribaculaceae bacterium]